MSSPKSRRELYSEATRAALVETATRMFATDGFVHTSLDDIATGTQVTRGAVYHHFANKQALFRAVIELQEADVVGRATAAALEHTEPWSAAMAALDTFLDSCCDPVYARLCWVEAPIALGWANWMDLESVHMLGSIETFVAMLVDAGILPAPTGQTAAQLMFHLLGGAGRIIAEASEESRAEARATVGLVVKGMVAGLRTDR